MAEKKEGQTPIITARQVFETLEALRGGTAATGMTTSFGLGSIPDDPSQPEHFFGGDVFRTQHKLSEENYRLREQLEKAAQEWLREKKGGEEKAALQRFSIE